jgi:LPXTG-motif cell wall-anchored protein
MKLQNFCFLFAFAFSIFFISGTVFAQEQQYALNSYSIDADVNRQGETSVKLVMVFTEPIDTFEMTLPFSIRNFNASSSAGKVVCNNQVATISIISCKIAQLEGRKTFEITFQSNDLVKSASTKNVFVSDFSIRIPAKDVFVAVRLPEGMVLQQEVIGGPTIPPAESVSTDGRRLTVIWRFTNIEALHPLSFQIAYEASIDASQFITNPLSLRWIALAGILVAGGLGFLYFRRRKKTQEVIFSVLDDYEKRVIDSIEKAGGTVNQKRVVVDTNLSKAKVSRVIQKLAERGLLEVERRGRTNIVKFSKKKLGS